MKRIGQILLLSITLLTPSILFGQYAENALRLSNLAYNGTARFTGIGGAFGAIGGDFTTLSINPAGIGSYNKCELIITPSIYNTRSFSNYFNSKNESFSTRMNLNNVGCVFAVPTHTHKKNNIQAIQFGIGYNRIANFNNEIFFKGFNDANTYTRSLADYATEYGVDTNYPIYPEDLAAITNLIFQNDNNQWTSDKDRNVDQQVNMKTEGGIDEMVFSLGGNFANKLYFGLTLGIPFMSYWSYYDYYERDKTGSTLFKDMHYMEQYSSSAAGVNGKFGLIYKPTNFFRLGAAIHTPTYYWNIEEWWQYGMQSHFYDSIQFNADASTPEGYYEYRQTTPMRVIGSAAFVLKDYALFSIDYEWADHSKNKLKMWDNSYSLDYSKDFSQDNQNIKDYYKSQHIVRAGVELHYKTGYLRGGYGWYSSPFQDKSVNDLSLNTWSLGAGVRLGAFGIDFAYQNARNHSKYYPYNVSSGAPYANLTNNANSYILSFSYRY